MGLPWIKWHSQASAPCIPLSNPTWESPAMELVWLGLWLVQRQGWRQPLRHLLPRSLQDRPPPGTVGRLTQLSSRRHPLKSTKSIEYKGVKEYKSIELQALCTKTQKNDCQNVGIYGEFAHLCTHWGTDPMLNRFGFYLDSLYLLLLLR